MFIRKENMSENLNLKTIETIDTSPFKHLCVTIGALPSSFVESMSYYECLAWLVSYIENTVIPAVNNNAEACAELQAAFIELKTFVDDYFENLDVQEEINNKLDDMAEQGTLQEIITTYIQANVAWTFDTVADMKLATNLINGSYARTIGHNDINDGGGCLYYISDTGVADEITVYAIDTLYAHTICTDVMNNKQFGCVADGNENDATLLQTALNYIKNKVSVFNISGTEIYLQDYIDLVGFENLTINFNTRVHRQSSYSTAKTFAFRLEGCKNIVFNHLDLYSERDQVELPPQDHTRVSQYGSNIIGIIMYQCNDMTFNNCKFDKLSTDFFAQKLDDDENNIRCYNININGWYSRDASGGLFMRLVNNLNITNADIVPANGMGKGDHFLYIGSYVDGVTVKDSKFINGDTNFGEAISFYNTETGATALTAPKNLFVDNCYFDICSNALAQHFTSNSMFVNCHIYKQSTNVNTFIIRDESYLVIDNCILDGNHNQIFEATSSSTFVIKNCEIKNAKSDCTNFVSATNSVSPKIEIRDNYIEWNNTLLYSGSSPTVTADITGNTIKQSNSSGNLLSVRKNAGRVNFNNNIVINGGSVSRMIYNGGSVTSDHFYVYFNTITGFTNLAAGTEIDEIHHDYNVIVA